MKNLPIDMLRTFVLVNDERSFTAAAARMGRTQPAVSQQLKKLELLLGQSLLNREGSQLELTMPGQTLMPYARQMLALNDEVVRTFDKPAVSGRVRLGIPSEFAITLLPKIVSRFAKAYPDVTLEVTCDLSRHLTSEDQRHEYDLILSLHNPEDSQTQPFIKSDELVWVGSLRSPVSVHPIVPLIAAPKGCIYRQRAVQCLQQVKGACRIVYTIPDLTGIQAAIDEGLGVTVLARSTVPASLVVLNDPNLPVLGTMGICLTRVGKGNDRAVAVLAEYIEAGLI